MNILCKCGIWNDYIDTNRAVHEGWDVYCHSCGNLIFDYQKARELERNMENRIRKEFRKEFK